MSPKKSLADGYRCEFSLKAYGCGFFTKIENSQENEAEIDSPQESAEKSLQNLLDRLEEILRNALAEDFCVVREKLAVVLRNKEQEKYSLRIFPHNSQENWLPEDEREKFAENRSQNFLAPAVYHLIWLYEGMKNKIICDNFVILHRLLRIWRFLLIFSAASHVSQGKARVAVFTQ